MNIDDKIVHIMTKMKQLSSKTLDYPCGKFPPEWQAPAMETDESLKMYELLESEKQSILSKLQEFTLEDLWYSQYYLFLVIMKERNAWNQVDYEQQKYKILENMDLEIEIDWTLIAQLEEEKREFKS